MCVLLLLLCVVRCGLHVVCLQLKLFVVVLRLASMCGTSLLVAVACCLLLVACCLMLCH